MTAKAAAVVLFVAGGAHAAHAAPAAPTIRGFDGRPVTGERIDAEAKRMMAAAKV
jgi:hypothetical protein